MEDYNSKSLEELRFEDYHAKQKFLQTQQQTRFGSTLLGNLDSKLSSVAITNKNEIDDDKQFKNNEKTLSNMDECLFYCALADNQHILEIPICLSCGHSICKKCIPRETTNFKCKICDRENKFDLSEAKESLGMKALLTLNLPKLYEILNGRYKASVVSLESM